MFKQKPCDIRQDPIRFSWYTLDGVHISINFAMTMRQYQGNVSFFYPTWCEMEVSLKPMLIKLDEDFGMSLMTGGILLLSIIYYRAGTTFWMNMALNTIKWNRMCQKAVSQDRWLHTEESSKILFCNLSQKMIRKIFRGNKFPCSVHILHTIIGVNVRWSVARYISKVLHTGYFWSFTSSAADLQQLFIDQITTWLGTDV